MKAQNTSMEVNRKQPPIPVYSYRPPRGAAPRQRPRNSTVIVLLVIILIGGLVAALAVRTALNDQRLPRDTTIAGVPVGGLAPEQAEAAVATAFAALRAQPVTLVRGRQIWQPDAATLGFAIDPSASVAQAQGLIGFHALQDRIRAWTGAAHGGHSYPLVTTLDEAVLRRYLLTLAAASDREPQNAAVQLNGTTVSRVTSAVGEALDIEAATHAIKQALPNIQHATVTLPSRAVPPATSDAQVEQAATALSALMSGPVTVTAAQQTFTIPVAELAGWAQVQWDQDTTPAVLQVTLDTAALRARIAPIATVVERAPVEPTVRFRGGALQIAQPGQDGARLDVEAATIVVADALITPVRSITLPVTVIQPQLRPETLASLGIQELVARGRSSFAGSEPYRVQNIKAGARRMDGVLIAPGAEFSFNAQVGAIDESNGFTKGYAIIDGRTQLEWGGGVCQVSTTVFRAAYWSGVPITERNQHAFRIFYYEQFEPIGMDAAIFTGPGGYDLRFMNDTEHWLLMQTSVDSAAGVLTVDLYGTKPDREVIQTDAQVTNERPAPDEPRYVRDPKLPPGTIKQTDRARGGMDVQVGRVVRQNGAIIRRDRFFSRYEAWPNIFTLGPGAEPPTPTPTPDLNQPTPEPSQPTPEPNAPTPEPSQPTPAA